MKRFEDTNPRAPSDDLVGIQSTPERSFETVLGLHGLPDGANSPLLRDDYELLLVWRQDRLWQAIRRVTGATMTADLEADAEETV